jgi:signal transduction histidine kinase
MQGLLAERTRMPRPTGTQTDTDQAASALKGDPIRKFNLAFAMMTVLPMLGFVFIITRNNSLIALEGQTGLLLVILLAISLLGYVIGYVVIRHFFAQIVQFNRALRRIEAGKMSVRGEVVDLRSILEEVIAQLGGKIAEKKLKFQHELPPGKAELWGDRDHLTRVFTNLLDNAVKYTLAEGAMGVLAKDTPEDYEVDVWNEGEELTAAQRAKIFERFERITEEKKTGTGLGLPIVKELVGLHYGSIRVESQRFTNHFVVNLPKDFRKKVPSNP